jgi:hypothetical protein
VTQTEKSTQVCDGPAPITEFSHRRSKRLRHQKTMVNKTGGTSARKSQIWPPRNLTFEHTTKVFAVDTHGMASPSAPHDQAFLSETKENKKKQLSIAQKD